MKNITLFLKKINTKDIFIAIVLMFYSTFSYSQVDLRTCGFNCTSNNYTLKDVYLSFEGVNGEPISNTTCTIGETKTVYVYLNYTSNSGSNIYHTRLQSDLTRNGQVYPIDLYMGTVAPGAGKNMIYTFNWTCGESISLTNTIIAWVTNDSNKLGANLPYDCNSYSSAQCDFTNLAVVSSPLAVQYTYKACKEGNNTTVSFTDITNGGTAPYSYSWNFGDGSPISTVANPVHTFTGPIVNKPRLTVTDSNPISPVSNFYELDIVTPSELTLTAVPTHISCGAGSTGAIDLTASGGNPGYTYLWTGTGVNPTSQNQSNLSAGDYNVTVTDNNGCQKQLLVTINAGDTTKPIVTAPTNTLIEGCSIANAGSLAFSTTVTAISAATFTQLGGTITDASAISSITYQDTQSGTCPIVITRIFTVTDLCGNFETASQTITIQDTTDPSWTTAATSLDRTIECSNTAALTAAQALAPAATDNCSTVTYTKISGTFVAGSCANSGTYTNTWIAKDVCLNESITFTQVITIQDTTDPTWTTAATNLNRTIECSNTAALATAQALAPVATDNCSTVTYTKVSGDFVAGSCANSGTYTNTWIAKDVCLNESTTFTQVITIQDTTDPTWTTAATNLNRTIECSDTAALTAAQALAPVATDNCSTVTYTKVSGTFVAGSCANSGTYTNTWIAKDVCLNESSTFTQVITIQDTTDPTWTTAAAALNSTVECSDTAALAAAQALAPVATDNCSTVTYTKVSGAFVAGSCANSGTYTNTWIAKDVCLNESTTFTQVITIQDTTDPSWTTAATSLDRTIECSNTAAIAAAQALAPVATDNCSTVTYTKVSGTFVAGSCANSGTYTNTWIAKDVCLNESTSFTQVITIQDTTDPTWTTAATNLNRTIECSNTAAIAAAQALAPVATDNCSIVTYTKVSGDFVAGSCANSGTYTNTWIAKDVCLNESTTFTQVITIQDTTDPTWTTAATNLNRTIECSNTDALATAQALAPVATDNCSTVTYTKVSGDFVAGSCANSGTYTNTWIAKDVCLNESTTFTQVITIQDTTDPTWTTAATALNSTVECSDSAALENAQALAPVATDNCSTVTYTKVSGAFVAGSCANSGTYTNTWIAKDVCLNESTTFTQIITIQDTTDPTWTTAAGSLDAALEFSDDAALVTAQAAFPVAADLCDVDVTNIVKVSGAFVPSVGCANAGTYTNTWTVNDDCGNTSAVFTQVITIGDAIPPTWTTLAGALDTTVECSDTAALATAQAAFPIATDLSDTDVTNIVKVPGVFVPSEGCTNAGTYTNTWTVTDDCGNTSAVFTQVITIQDTTAPTWTTAAAALNTTVECSDTAALATAQAVFPVAADLCDVDVTNIVKVPGAFVPSVGCANAGTYTNTWTVNDDCGNTSALFTQVITIEDTTAPTWTTAAATLNTTVECSDTAALATAQAAFPVAADLCDVDVTNIVKVPGVFVPSQGCANAGTYTNTWTVTDDCGNPSAVFTQVITIEDTTAPTWTTAAAALNTTVECSDAAALATAQAAFPIAADLCDVDITNIVKVSGVFVPSEGCANAGTYTNTWTVSDNCGNTSAVFTQIITIEDSTAPVVTSCATDQTVASNSSCEAIVPDFTSTIQVSDNCTPSASLIITQSPAAGSVVTSGTTTVIVTAEDDCGNKVTCEAKLTVTNFIVANDDAGSPVNSYTGGISFTNVLTNDLLNCTAVNPQDVAITTISSTHAGITLSGTDVVVAAGTPAGSYTLIYQICEIANNTNCDQATVTVTVTATPIDAVEDSASTFDGSNGTQNILNVFTNDTLNNIAVNPAEVTLITVIPNNNLILNPDGSVDVLPGTPQGIYELTYQICENAVPGNCDQAVVSITVALPRMANSAPNLFRTINCDDTVFSVNPLLSVTINDQPVSIDKVTIKLIAGINSSITLDDTGSVNIANGLPVGNYKLLYQVCEKLNPDNCITGFITITVQDINKPVFAQLPEPKTISCDEPVVFEPAIATDTCSSVTLTHEDTTVLGSCPGSSTITRTWTATDASGNFSNASQIIIVEDKTGPTTAAPFIASIDANCNDIPSADLVTFVDNCSEVTQEEFTENIINPTQSSYSIVRKWIVTDSCENTSEFIQVINVTIANSVVNINSEACNADSSTVNLSDKLPAGTPTNGVWTALSNAVSLNGSIFSPFGLAINNYSFEYKIPDEFCPRSIIVNMAVNDDCRVLACNSVKVHNAFSPNGDGRNDTFVIANINDECYTGNSIEIYNRWGVLVFDTKDYNNESNYFDGTSRGRSTINQSSGLPTGTYFYILNYSYLDVNDTVVSKKEDGYLYLTK